MIKPSNVSNTAIIAFCFYFAQTSAYANYSIGAYLGYSYTFKSDVAYASATESFTLHDVKWRSESFKFPPFYGFFLSKTFMHNDNEFGLLLDYSHTKVVADSNNATSRFNALEFTDGLNVLTLNIFKRETFSNKLTFDYGLGGGFAFPHVEVQRAGVAEKTYEYQITGAALQGLIGLNYGINDDWSWFTQYKLTYTHNDADLQGNASLKTNLWTNQFIAGISYTL